MKTYAFIGSIDAAVATKLLGSFNPVRVFLDRPDMLGEIAFETVDELIAFLTAYAA